MNVQKNRILFLLTYYYPHWTGLTQYAKRLAEALAGTGYAVTVIAAKHQNDLVSMEIINNVKVCRFSVWFRLSRTLVSPLLFILMLREIPRSDQVIIYLPYAEVMPASIIAKLFRKKIVLIHNGDLKLPSGILNRFLEFFYYITTRWSIYLSDYVIAQTNDYAKQSYLLSGIGKKLKIILPLYSQSAELQKSAKSFPGVSNGMPNIGFAGRFVEEKGFDRLFKAIPFVLKEFPKGIFTYAGETDISYENFFARNTHLIEPVKAHVRFLGRLNEDGMKKFYRQLDVLVVSSRSDCFPSVLVEALLNGVPVVVADIPGARVSVKITGMGVLADANNPERLAEAIIEAYQNRSKLRKNWPKALSLFDYENTLQQFRSLIG